MANATLRYRQAQYKSCPLYMYLITPESAVKILDIFAVYPGKRLTAYK